MYHFIVNSTASSGLAFDTWKTVKKVLEESKIPFELHTPDSAEESIKIAQELSSGNEKQHIIVIGGDGTLNTILQGINDFDKATLSIIPAGSGNDFAKALGISSNPMKAIKHLLENPVEETMDYGLSVFSNKTGQKKTHRFIISCGAGYDAEICEEVNRSSEKSFLNKLHLGKLIYVYTAIKKIFSFKNYIKKHACDANIILDEEHTIYIDNLFLTVAMNTPYQGGGVPFCPMADWKDGSFDICSVAKMTTPMLFLCIMMVYLKKHFMFKQVTHYRCKKIELNMKSPRWLHTDGETHFEADTIIMECHQGLHFLI